MMEKEVQNFLSQSQFPLVVVSTIPSKDRKAVVDFLLRLEAPVYLEGVSGIREEPRLDHLKITSIQKVWEVSAEAEYSIDGILRIGGVPTFRPWRDLEEKRGTVNVCSISHLPFSGLSWGGVIPVSLSDFLPTIDIPQNAYREKSGCWLEIDRRYSDDLLDLIKEEPRAEQSLFHALSMSIPENSLVYIGNSLPIREWDLTATQQQRGLEIFATRGLNGIDGQVSTFLGMARPQRSNWGIFGDLTMLYDLSGPWILRQLEGVKVNLVVVNNGGGMIFSRMFPHQEFLNAHPHHFENIAKHWGLEYFRGEEVPGESTVSRLIELTPDSEATNRFWKGLQAIGERVYAG